MDNSKQRFSLIFIMALLTKDIAYAVGPDYGMGKAVFKLIFYTVIFILVIIAAIYGTRFIAKSSKKFVNSKYMRIVDILHLDANTKITLVEIKNYIYVFAININTVGMIDKFPKEELETIIDFDEQLDKYKNMNVDNRTYINRFKSNISKFFIKANKLIDKEDENHEKKC